MGLGMLFQPGHLGGIAEGDLAVDEVVQGTFLLMNEEGAEAAAASAVIIGPVSAVVDESVPVVLDRPFLFRRRRRP